jgi:hypothetical protein
MLLTIARVYECWKWATENENCYYRGKSFVTTFLNHELKASDQHTVVSTVVVKDSYSANQFAEIFSRIKEVEIVRHFENSIGIHNTDAQRQTDLSQKGGWFRANIGEGLVYYFEEINDKSVSYEIETQMVKLVGPLSDFELFSVLLATECSDVVLHLPMPDARQPSLRATYVEVSRTGIVPKMGKLQILGDAKMPKNVAIEEHFKRAFDWMKEQCLNNGYIDSKGWKNYSGTWTSLAQKFRTEITLDCEIPDGSITITDVVATQSLSLGLSKSTYGSLGIISNIAASHLCADNESKARCFFEISRELYLTASSEMALQQLQHASHLAPNNVNFAQTRKLWLKGTSWYEKKTNERIKTALSAAQSRWVAGSEHVVHRVHALKNV